MYKLFIHLLDCSTRDLFEDELRSFQGGNDGLVPCLWANELPSFPKVKNFHDEVGVLGRI